MEKIDNQTIIAGPCAVEGKSQLYDTVKNIYLHTHIIRAGIWKGRTSPQDYSGVGEEGLTWIQDLQKKYHRPFAIEVGTVRHVELALKKNIKIMWLGARTTVNPFAVEELAASFRGLNVEVWVKNPIIPDIKLWIGAIERLRRVGVKNIKTIHRGFYSEQKKPYRNHPRWDLLNDFQHYCPEIPIICDPSHIAGDTDHIDVISRDAKKKNVDGFMFEVHNNPQKALSDSRQQLTPNNFKQLMGNLNFF